MVESYVIGIATLVFELTVLFKVFYLYFINYRYITLFLWKEWKHIHYSLRPILPFANTDLSSTKMCLNKSIFMKGNMGRREYLIIKWVKRNIYAIKFKMFCFPNYDFFILRRVFPYKIMYSLSVEYTSVFRMYPIIEERHVFKPIEQMRRKKI
jgi:hypothetical protein